MTAIPQRTENSDGKSPYRSGQPKGPADVNANHLATSAQQQHDFVVGPSGPPQAKTGRESLLPSIDPMHSDVPTNDNDYLGSLRAALLNHPLYADVASLADLRRFMEDHVFAVWDFMSLLKRLQQDMTCTGVPWFPADNANAARLINDIVIGEETDVDPDGSYVSHLELYLRAMGNIGASTRKFSAFCALAQAGVPVDEALERVGVPRHVQVFVAHTMALAHSGTTEEVLAAFFCGREDVIPEMFRKLLQTLYGTKHNDGRLRHFVYYVDRHIELDGDSHGPMGRELLEGLVANSPHRNERALRAACSSIKARIKLWDGTLNEFAPAGAWGTDHSLPPRPELISKVGSHSQKPL